MGSTLLSDEPVTVATVGSVGRRNAVTLRRLQAPEATRAVGQGTVQVTHGHHDGLEGLGQPTAAG